MRERACLQLNPEAYFRRFFEYDIRPDGRQMLEIRVPKLKTHILKYTLGSSILAAGRTRFCTGITAEIGPPLSQAPSSGRILVNVEFPKVCGLINTDSTSYVPGGLSASQASATLTQILTSPDVIDLSQLCIKTNSAVWSLYINIVCLEYDGNSLDWALASAVAALEDTTLPNLVWCSKMSWWRIDDEEDSVYNEAISKHKNNELLSSDENDKTLQQCDTSIKWKGIRIQLNARPTCLTVTKLLEKYWVADPTAQEDQLGSAISVWRAGSSGTLHILRFKHKPSAKESNLTEDSPSSLSIILAAIANEKGSLVQMENMLCKEAQQQNVSEEHCWVVCPTEDNNTSQSGLSDDEDDKTYKEISTDTITLKNE